MNSTASDTGAGAAGAGAGAAPVRFPHTRAQLSAIARQYNKPTRIGDSYDSDVDGADDLARVNTALVNKVVALLDGEHEDELKELLKETFCPTMDDEEVRSPSSSSLSSSLSLSLIAPFLIYTSLMH